MQRVLRPHTIDDNPFMFTCHKMINNLLCNIRFQMPFKMQFMSDKIESPYNDAYIATVNKNMLNNSYSMSLYRATTYTVVCTCCKPHNCHIFQCTIVIFLHVETKAFYTNWYIPYYDNGIQLVGLSQTHSDLHNILTSTEIIYVLLEYVPSPFK